MPILEKFDRFNQKVSFWIEWVGLAGILMMMSVTCVDVVGAKVFRLPVPGALDIVMMSQLLSVAFAVAATLILGRHVEVEFFVPLLPRTLQTIIDTIVHFLCLLLFILICRQLFAYGYFMQTGHEVSPTLRLPLYIFAYAAAVSCIPVCLVYLHRFLLSATRIFKK